MSKPTMARDWIVAEADLYGDNGLSDDTWLPVLFVNRESDGRIISLLLTEPRRGVVPAVCGPVSGVASVVCHGGTNGAFGWARKHTGTAKRLPSAITRAS